MNYALHLTGFDFAIIALLLLLVLRGFWVGFLRQVTTLVALIVGYVVTGQYNDKLLPFLRGLSEDPRIVFWASCVILFVATYVVTMLLGKGLARVVELTVAGWFDKLLGGVLGAAKALILIVFLNMILSGVLPPENSMLRNCQLCPYANQATDFCRSLIKGESMQNIFLQKKPAISGKTEKQSKPATDKVRPLVPAKTPKK